MFQTIISIPILCFPILCFPHAILSYPYVSPILCSKAALKVQKLAWVMAVRMRRACRTQSLPQDAKMQLFSTVNMCALCASSLAVGRMLFRRCSAHVGAVHARGGADWAT